MDKFTIINENNKINIIIDKIKIFYGKNYSLKKRIIANLEQALTKNSSSEYAKNTYKEIDLNINDQKINTSQFEIYKITSDFDIDSDLKLGTKSLCQKYLEKKLENLEYNDLYNTIKELLKIFDMEYLSNNTNMQLSLSNLNFQTGDLEIKQFIKLIKPKLIENDLEKNYFDLTYEELIEYQLNMIYEIAKDNDKTHIIIIDTHLTKNLFNKILNINEANIKFIILQNLYNDNIKLADYILINNKILDLADEENINTFIFEELPFHLEPNEINEIFIEYLKNNKTSKVIELFNVL